MFSWCSVLSSQVFKETKRSANRMTDIKLSPADVMKVILIFISYALFNAQKVMRFLIISPSVDFVSTVISALFDSVSFHSYSLVTTHEK